MKKKLILDAKRAIKEHQTHGNARPDLVVIGMLMKISGQLHELNNNIGKLSIERVRIGNVSKPTVKTGKNK